MAFITVLLLAAVFAGVDAWKASAQGPNGNNPPCGEHGYDSGWNQGGMMGHMGSHMMGGWNTQGSMMGHTGGMMHGWGDWEDCVYGYPMGSMMGGWGNQQGWSGQSSNYPYMGGYGMMGGWAPPAELAPAGDTLTLDEAIAIAEAYIAAQNDSNLALGEVIQFSNNFYAEAVEVESGHPAFEFLIDPATGAVYPEPGPNMMWNLRYGMHAGGGMMGQWSTPAGTDDGTTLTVSPEQARQSAQQFLDNNYSGLTAASEADTFDGYYTFEVLQGENIVGMLSVNGYTGQVWVHTWHGDFVTSTEADE
jgi:hypothetical protein